MQKYNNLEGSDKSRKTQGGKKLQLDLSTLITFDPCLAPELII